MIKLVYLHIKYCFKGLKVPEDWEGSYADYEQNVIDKEMGFKK